MLQRACEVEIMAKAKAKAPLKPRKEKPVKAKKEKAPKATKQPKAVKPRGNKKDRIKSDLYTMILLLAFFALATASVFIYLNNSWHQTHI